MALRNAVLRLRKKLVVLDFGEEFFINFSSFPQKGLYLVEN